MAVSADIFVNDDSVLSDPIDGVIVGVFDSTTYAPIAQGTTDVTGKATFLLPGAVSPGLDYEVRLFKLGVLFDNPFLVSVIEPVVTTNKFDVTGTLLSLTPAVDPRLCRCTGRFMNFSNSPMANIAIRIMPISEAGFQNPKVVDGNMVAADGMLFHTDEDGMISIDLLRNAQFFIMFAGEDEENRCITIPDRTSVNLIDLIHPVPVSASWDSTDAPGNAVSIQVGETKEVKFSLLFTDYQTRSSGISEYVLLDNSDDTKAAAVSRDGSIVLDGLVAGTTNITITEKPGVLPVTIPAYTVTAPTLVVTVTP